MTPLIVNGTHVLAHENGEDPEEYSGANSPTGTALLQQLHLHLRITVSTRPGRHRRGRREIPTRRKIMAS